MKLNLKYVEVLYEDNHLIAVNKPAGWLVHGDETKDTPFTEYVKQWIKKKYNKPGNVFLGVIHRIDRPCLLYTSPSPRDRTRSRMPSSA